MAPEVASVSCVQSKASAVLHGQKHQLLISANAASDVGKRQWIAKLDMSFLPKQGKTRLTHLSHLGPLRVQKPFYPEDDGCCHVYVLHPPGGMVVGDELTISAEVHEGAKVLLTTPSAGKIYGAKHLTHPQLQTINLSVENDGCIEWLPQETIVFDGANGRLATRITMSEHSRLFVWDIVRLGRAASGEKFEHGVCYQSLEIWQGDTPYFIERNCFAGGAELQSAKWGMQGANTTGTLCATLSAPRELIDECLTYLNSASGGDLGLWGLTQKNALFVARYLGDSVSQCRHGFEYLWRTLRPLLNNKTAVVPRIWQT